jgi:putative redox protein
MKATARRAGGEGFQHTVEMRTHHLTVDEPSEKGGTDEGPTPLELLAASLASCTAITVEMYAQRKGWEIGPVDVVVEYTPGESGEPTKFDLELRLSDSTTEEQRERLRLVSRKCPVHRLLEGDVVVEDHLTIAPATA